MQHVFVASGHTLFLHDFSVCRWSCFIGFAFGPEHFGSQVMLKRTLISKAPSHSEAGTQGAHGTLCESIAPSLLWTHRLPCTLFLLSLTCTPTYTPICTHASQHTLPPSASSRGSSGPRALHSAAVLWVRAVFGHSPRDQTGPSLPYLSAAAARCPQRAESGR